MINRTEFLDDIRITAFEGGINYWAKISGNRVKDPDDPNSQWVALTDSKIEAGIALVKHLTFQVNNDILASILLGDRNNDAGEIDIECADVIVQAAVFGEIVYG